MSMKMNRFVAVGGCLAVLLFGSTSVKPVRAAGPKEPPASNRIGRRIDQPRPRLAGARENWKMPFKDEQPILFVNRGQAAAEWDKLPAFWNETTDKDRRPDAPARRWSARRSRSRCRSA